MTKMAGVTQEKAWFRKGRVCSSLTLWTDASVDQNFQRDLRAIGPYEFQGKFVWTNPWCLVLKENLYGPIAPKVQFPPRLALVHGKQRTIAGLESLSHELAEQNLSSTELESANALGAFLQTRAPVLDNISGPMGAQFLSSTGLGSDTLTGRAQFLSAPALDKNSQSPMSSTILTDMFTRQTPQNLESAAVKLPTPKGSA